MTFLHLKLKFIFIANILPCCKEDMALHFAIFCRQHIEWGEAAEAGDINIVFTATCRSFRGCVFMTGPKVLRNRETSMLWFGVSGLWMARGVPRFTPKLFLFNWIAKSHVLQSFVGEAHFQKHVPLADGQMLQKPSLYCRQSHSLRGHISTRCPASPCREFKYSSTSLQLVPYIEV